jgi:hypothetical protein
MNWQAIGAIGEIIGSMTVVITVAYLAVQIRQSGKAARSVSTNHARAAVADVMSAVSGDTDSVKTYTKGMFARDELELHERVRFDLIIFQTLRVIETLFLEYREGLLEKEVWLGQWRGELTILATPGGRASWAVQRTYLSASFMEWVDEQLELADAK